MSAVKESGRASGFQNTASQNASVTGREVNLQSNGSNLVTVASGGSPIDIRPPSYKLGDEKSWKSYAASITPSAATLRGFASDVGQGLSAVADSLGAKEGITTVPESKRVTAYFPRNSNSPWNLRLSSKASLGGLATAENILEKTNHKPQNQFASFASQQILTALSTHLLTDIFCACDVR